MTDSNNAKKLPMTFDEWWIENQFQYSSDSLHMSEYHMAAIVWEAAVASERAAQTTMQCPSSGDESQKVD